MEVVAFYGAGMLGSGFVKALCADGLRVRVWNRTHARAAALEQFGAQAFQSPADAARGADRIHLCLRSDDSVDEVLDAALSGVATGTPVIDHTTVLPQNVITREQQLRDRDIPFLHAPVFMGPPNAAERTGLMLCSGELRRFERVRAALEAMTGELWYLGERADKAAVFKLMGNAMILAIIGGLRDVFTIAQSNGIDRPDAYTLFEKYNPCGQIAGRGRRMAMHEYEPTWTLQMADKDADLMLRTGGDLTVIAAVKSVLRDALARGLGDRDLGAVAAV